MPKTTICTNKKNSAPPQLAVCGVGDDGPMLALKKDGTPCGKELLFAKEELSELCFDIIGDIDTNDDDYDPDVRHLISYPNNNKTKQNKTKQNKTKQNKPTSTIKTSSRPSARVTTAIVSTNQSKCATS
eukprot:2212148-Ditylum_brightwellii.AAC.1